MVFLFCLILVAKVAAGYEFVEGDIQFLLRNSLCFVTLTTSAGFLAGFLGIGAGMLLGLMMLSLGLIPLVFVYIPLKIITKNITQIQM